ncbi:hypothetical protein BD410DRAFT_843027 [Rickenella mellea]|uniref:Uncharacterized protein n=1 Tax=Rickenella mellea TaxID=50990 RepID=A0A4Y7PSY9_9AGAM|nr:hypothetical protein BD410DRAFT_843027 [Rickenella mellea]
MADLSTENQHLTQDIIDRILVKAAAMPQFLGNFGCVKNRELEPRAVKDSSPHQIMYEIIDGRAVRFTACVIAEMGCREDGVKLGAAGNRDEGDIKDGDSIKMVFVGKVVGLRTPLADLWTDQVVGLMEVEDIFFGGEENRKDIMADNEHYLVRSLVHAPRDRTFTTHAQRVPWESIHLFTEPLYTIPKTGNRNVHLTAPVRSARTGPSTSTTTEAHTAPPVQITSNTTYELTELPDHVGPRFTDHVKSRVVQFHIEDDEKHLVRPSQFYQVYAPGTIFIAAVYFRKWDMDDKYNKNRRNITFQLCIESMKVLVPSSRPAEQPPIPATSDVEVQPVSTASKHVLDDFDIAADVSAHDSNKFNVSPDQFSDEMDVSETATSPIAGPSSVHPSATGSASGPLKKKLITHKYYMKPPFLFHTTNDPPFFHSVIMRDTMRPYHRWHTTSGICTGDGPMLYAEHAVGLLFPATGPHCRRVEVPCTKYRSSYPYCTLNLTTMLTPPYDFSIAYLPTTTKTLAPYTIIAEASMMLLRNKSLQDMDPDTRWYGDILVMKEDKVHRRLFENIAEEEIDDIVAAVIDIGKA